MRGAIAALALVVASAAPALPPPVAQIAPHAVSFDKGRIAVRVPPAAKYIGGDRFVLYDIADCELHLFVEVGPDRVVRRSYWVQRESYLPSRPELTHAYATTKDKREQHWGLGVWTGEGVSRSAEPDTPGSDSAHIKALLKKARYTLPSEMRTVRFVHLLDEPGESGHGRHELMIIYSEAPGQAGSLTARAEHRIGVRIAKP